MGHLVWLEAIRVVGYALCVPMLVTLAFLTYRVHRAMGLFCFLQAGVYFVQLYGLVLGGQTVLSPPAVYVYSAMILSQGIIATGAVYSAIRFRRKILKNYTEEI